MLAGLPYASMHYNFHLIRRTEGRCEDLFYHSPITQNPSPIFFGSSFDHFSNQFIQHLPQNIRFFDFGSLLKLPCLCPALQCGALPQSGTLQSSQETQLLRSARSQSVVKTGQRSCADRPLSGRIYDRLTGLQAYMSSLG